MSRYVSYDSENDIFVIHKGFSEGDSFKGNLDVGDLVLDISKKGDVCGIEILNASAFFKDLGIDKRSLSGLIDARFNTSQKPDSIVLGISLRSKYSEKELPAKIAVPIAPA